MIINIFGQQIKLSNLTPRLFWENDCNVVLIKPSSYLVVVSASVTEHMIPDKNKIITSYDTNLGNYSELGLKPMCYFHPYGMKYQKQMQGPSKIILVKDDAKLLNTKNILLGRILFKKLMVNMLSGLMEVKFCGILI